jgi:hypothetical protein
MMRLAPQLEDVAIALTIFIFIFSIPSIRSLAKGNWRVKNPNHDHALYGDEDGAASTESTDQFSNKLQFVILFVLAWIGLGLSIADAVFTTIQEKSRTASSGPHHVGIFLLVPAWVRDRS